MTIFFFAVLWCNSSEPFAQSVIYTDTSSHFRLFVDGRLAGSSCLVGCAGVRPRRTSWQPCLRQPCAFLLALSLSLSSGMICVEQKHHSTQSLDPRPGAICKTLQSNTRASYDPRQGSSAEKMHPGRVSEVKSNLSRSVCEGLWHKKVHWGGLSLVKLSGKLLPPKKGQLTSVQNDQNPVYLLDESRSLGDLFSAVVAGCWVHPHAVAKATQTFSHAQSKHVYRMLLDPYPDPHFDGLSSKSLDFKGW